MVLSLALQAVSSSICWRNQTWIAKQIAVKEENAAEILYLYITVETTIGWDVNWLNLQNFQATFWRKNVDTTTANMKTTQQMPVAQL